jgi:hypothetical protein
MSWHELRITSKCTRFEIMPADLHAAFQDPENADILEEAGFTDFANGMTCLRDVHKEEVYTLEGGMKKATFCKVLSQADAVMLCKLSGLMLRPPDADTTILAYSVNFERPLDRQNVRAQWRQVGHSMEKFKDARAKLETMGAVQESGMYTLPSRFRDKAECLSLLDEIEQQVADMTGRGPLDPRVRSILSCKPVDLKAMQERVWALNQTMITALLELRRLKATTNLEFDVPGYDVDRLPGR